MPGAVSHTSTYALTNVTLPYQLEVARNGARNAVEKNPALAHGLNTHHGHVTYEAVATALSLAFVTPRDAVNE
jgi:alanine dehydrogenase